MEEADDQVLSSDFGFSAVGIGTKKRGQKQKSENSVEQLTV